MSNDFISCVQTKHPKTNKDLLILYKAMVDQIWHILMHDQHLELRGMGSFVVTLLPPRFVFRPKVQPVSKALIQTKKRFKCRFRPSVFFKRALS